VLKYIYYLMILHKNGTGENSADNDGTINRKLGKNSTFTILGLKI